MEARTVSSLVNFLGQVFTPTKRISSRWARADPIPSTRVLSVIPSVNVAALSRLLLYPNNYSKSPYALFLEVRKSKEGKLVNDRALRQLASQKRRCGKKTLVVTDGGGRK